MASRGKNPGADTEYVLIVRETDFGRSYGISCKRGKDSISEIPDISFDKSFVEAMAESFNEEALSPVHFSDVVEDMLP